MGQLLQKARDNFPGAIAPPQLLAARHIWTAFIAFIAFFATFKDQLSLSKVMTLEQGQLRSLLSEEQLS